MIYSISPEIFKNADHIKMLDKIWLLSEERHRFHIYDDESIEAVMESQWYEGLRKTDRQTIFKLIEETLQSSKGKQRPILIATQGQDYLTLEEAFYYLTQPLLIYLENSLNDPFFLDSLISKLPAGAILTYHKNQNWVSYEMGGGANNIQNAILGKIKSVPGNNAKLLRSFVLLDSDREFLGADLKNDKAKLIAFLEENGIEFHVLEKREMENYMPDEIIESIAINDSFIDTYLQLNELQKDYIDLEKGFQMNSNTLERKKPNVYSFYRNLNAEQIEMLRYGLENHFNNFKSDFPKLFYKSTHDGLLRRTKNQNDPNELENILNKITSLL